MLISMLLSSGMHRGVDHHLAGGNLAGGDHRDRAARFGLVQVDRIGGHQEIEAQVEIGRARGDLVGALDRLGADLEVGHHRPALLAEPGLVEPAHMPAVQHRGGAEDLVHGDDAGAADAHHVEREALARHLQRGLGQVGVERGHPPLPLGRRPGALDGEERRAVPEQARVVLVAGGLVDRGLPAELGVDRLHRQAVRLLAAVPTPLAHPLVDEDAGQRVDHLAALAQPPLLRRAVLVVDQHGDAVDAREQRLGLQQPVAMPDLRVARDRHPRVLGGIVAGDDDALDPFRLETPAERGDRQGPRVLAAGHRHRAVVEDLVGDVTPETA
jgi:hypothetical protein